jgi:hypothetical protein
MVAYAIVVKLSLSHHTVGQHPKKDTGYSREISRNDKSVRQHCAYKKKN